MNLKLWVGRPLAPVPPEFLPSFRFDRVWDRWGFGAGVRYQPMLRSRSLVRALLTSTVIAAAIALAGCASDGTPASTENSGSIGSFVRNLFGIKSEDQAAVAHNEASVEPPAPKTKPATSKPKHPAVAAAGATQPKSVPQPGPSAEPQKKSAQPQKKAGPNEKALHAKREREAPQATARSKANKAAVQEQTTDSVSQKAQEANPAVVPSPRVDEPLNDERRDERLVTTAGTAWPALPNTEGAGVSAPGATGGEPTETANANAVQLVDPNEVNDLDRAAAATVSTESSWSTYLLLILGAALAAASATWFLVKMPPVYARRAAVRRGHGQ